MKRTVAGLLAAVMTASMLTGCGGGGSASGTQAATTAGGDSAKTESKAESTESAGGDKTVYPAGDVYKRQLWRIASPLMKNWI